MNEKRGSAINVPYRVTQAVSGITWDKHAFLNWGGRL